MATNSFISSTKEYQVLKKYFSILTYAITSPVTLAADLFSADLISDSTRMKANTDSSTRESRNHYILDDLMIAVAIDTTNLTKIISVLQGHRPFLNVIANKMTKDYYGNEYHSNDYIFHVVFLLFLQRCQHLKLQMNIMY